MPDRPRYIPPANPSPYLRAFLNFIDAYCAWDHGRIMDVYDDSLEHYILPRSLGRPIRNKEVYGEYLKTVIPMFKSFKVNLHEVYEVGEHISAHASSVGESTLGTPYSNEYNLIVHCVPMAADAPPSTLPKISLVKEFVDSAYSKEFFGAEAAKTQAQALVNKES